MDMQGLSLKNVAVAVCRVIEAQYEEVPVSLETIAMSMFSGDSLDLIYLKGVTLYRMTGVNGAWDRLLSEWTS